jgi:hypothetical protein
MYKKLITIIGIMAVTAGVLSWQLTSFSQSDSIYAEDCDNGACCIAYREGMSTIKNAWNNNLSGMMNQEKPASEMVDEAFENLRTYQCQLEYTCRAVHYSGYGTPESAEGGLTSAHLGVIPGCQAPEDMGLIDGWDTFVNFLKNDWEFFATIFQGGGSAEINVRMPDTLFATNAMPFIPQCMTDPTNKNSDKKIELAITLYDQCMELVDAQFGCKDFDDNIGKCTGESIAFVKLENELRKNNARQKAGILENKLVSILNKMKGMEANVSVMKEKLSTLSNKCACYPPSCT